MRETDAMDGRHAHRSRDADTHTSRLDLWFKRPRRLQIPILAVGAALIGLITAIRFPGIGIPVGLATLTAALAATVCVGGFYLNSPAPKPSLGEAVRGTLRSPKPLGAIMVVATVVLLWGLCALAVEVASGSPDNGSNDDADDVALSDTSLDGPSAEPLDLKQPEVLPTTLPTTTSTTSPPVSPTTTTSDAAAPALRPDAPTAYNADADSPLAPHRDPCIEVDVQVAGIDSANEVCPEEIVDTVEQVAKEIPPLVGRVATAALSPLGGLVPQDPSSTE